MKKRLYLCIIAIVIVAVLSGCSGKAEFPFDCLLFSRTQWGFTPGSAVKAYGQRFTDVDIIVLGRDEYTVDYKIDINDEININGRNAEVSYHFSRIIWDGESDPSIGLSRVIIVYKNIKDSEVDSILKNYKNEIGEGFAFDGVPFNPTGMTIEKLDNGLSTQMKDFFDLREFQLDESAPLSYIKGEIVTDDEQRNLEITYNGKNAALALYLSENGDPWAAGIQ